MSKTIIQRKVEGIMDSGKPKKDWMANITQSTNKTIDQLLNKSKDRDGWRRFVIVASEMIPLRCLCRGIEGKVKVR